MLTKLVLILVLMLPKSFRLTVLVIFRKNLMILVVKLVIFLSFRQNFRVIRVNLRVPVPIMASRLSGRRPFMVIFLKVRRSWFQSLLILVSCQTLVIRRP